MKTYFGHEALRGLMVSLLDIRCCLLKRRGGPKFNPLHVVVPMCLGLFGRASYCKDHVPAQKEKKKRRESMNEAQNPAFSHTFFVPCMMEAAKDSRVVNNAGTLFSSAVALVLTSVKCGPCPFLPLAGVCPARELANAEVLDGPAGVAQLLRHCR